MGAHKSKLKRTNEEHSVSSPVPATPPDQLKPSPTPSTPVLSSGTQSPVPGSPLNTSGTQPSSPESKRTPRRANSWSRKRAEELFLKYQAAGENCIGPEQMMRLCDDLGIAPEDPAMLILSWKLNAKSMGYFTKEEWLTGLCALKIDSMAQLKVQTKAMKAELDVEAQFPAIYKYAFLFSRERDQKLIDLATADGLIGLLLSPRTPHGELFRQYLKEQTSYKGVNLDQWMSLLDFTNTVKKDFAAYDENGAWPVMLDEYVQWALASKKALVTPE